MIEKVVARDQVYNPCLLTRQSGDRGRAGGPVHMGYAATPSPILYRRRLRFSDKRDSHRG